MFRFVAGLSCASSVLTLLSVCFCLLLVLVLPPIVSLSGLDSALPLYLVLLLFVGATHCVLRSLSQRWSFFALW
ncbi:putative membrane protein [Synechococcus sp. PROS-7-1]|nr:putative membrane protein [Synechococcus sp. PROS-7-1]